MRKVILFIAVLLVVLGLCWVSTPYVFGPPSTTAVRPPAMHPPPDEPHLCELAKAVTTIPACAETSGETSVRKTLEVGFSEEVVSVVESLAKLQSAVDRAIRIHEEDVRLINEYQLVIERLVNERISRLPPGYTIGTEFPSSKCLTGQMFEKVADVVTSADLGAQRFVCVDGEWRKVL